ncbi:hypothetical protein [Salidesulfovibrio onnuriiensis]|nr:hypothetical protein [Salidesulfovibrio onnuriiensis]
MTTGISITLAASALVILYRVFFKSDQPTMHGIDIDFDRAKEHELNRW